MTRLPDSRSRVASGDRVPLETARTTHARELELALAEPSSRVEAMKKDLGEMEHMIDEYLAFARGEAGEDVFGVFLKDYAPGAW